MYGIYYWYFKKIIENVRNKFATLPKLQTSTGNRFYTFTKMFYIIPYSSWSRSGRKLLSAATDNTVSVWDVLHGEVEKTFRFPSPILKVQFHPRSRFVAITQRISH